MPIYEYLCQSCSTKYEAIVLNSSAEAKVACPHCGSERKSLQLSVFAVAAGNGNGKSPRASLADGGGCAGNPSVCGCSHSH